MQQLHINDSVRVKTDGDMMREGVILALEEFNEGVMYLIALPDYPQGIWFFNEKNNPGGIFVHRLEE